MAMKNFTFVSKLIFFWLVICIALLVISERKAMAAAVGRTGKRPPKEWLYYAGECAKLQDCKKYCLTTGFPLGGSCQKLSPQASFLACICKYT